MLASEYIFWAGGMRPNSNNDQQILAMQNRPV